MPIRPARGRIFQGEDFVFDELDGALVERFVGCADRAGIEPPDIFFLKASGHLWQRFSLDAGLCFWEEYGDEQIAEELKAMAEDGLMVDCGAQLGIVGDRIGEVRGEPGPRIRIALTSGDFILETTDENTLDAPSRVRFERRYGGPFPEQELLDQLLAEPMTLDLLRPLFVSDRHFARAVAMMLQEGELILLDGEAREAPAWKSREILANPGEWARGTRYQLSVTARGARRVS